MFKRTERRGRIIREDKVGGVMRGEQKGQTNPSVYNVFRVFFTWQAAGLHVQVGDYAAEGTLLG